MQQNFDSCNGILRLESKVGPESLELACKRALEYQQYSSTAVHNILEKGLEKTDIDLESIELPDHENIRGNNYYK